MGFQWKPSSRRPVLRVAVLRVAVLPGVVTLPSR